MGGEERLNQLFVFGGFGGASDVQEPAAGAQYRGRGLQHGPLPRREGLQIGLSEAGFDLRVTPENPQGGARGVHRRRPDSS